MPARREGQVPTRLPNLTTRVILIVTAIAVTYFMVTGVLNAVRSHQLSQDEKQLRSEIQGLEARFEQLQALRDYLNSDEYIETVAREQLGLVREGETSIVAISTAPTPTPTQDDQQSEEGEGVELWWEALIR